MTRILSFLSLCFFCVFGTAGCSSAWWQQIVQNPAAAVQTFETETTIIVQGLTATFDGVCATLPAQDCAKAKVVWQEQIDRLTIAEKALQSGVDAAVQLKTGSPDFTKLIADVVDVVVQVKAFVETFMSAHPTPPVITDGGVSARPTFSAPNDMFFGHYVGMYGRRSPGIK